MAHHPSKFTTPLLLMAMVVLALSARAQSSDRSIIFSTPKSDDGTMDTPSLSPQNSLLPILPDSLQAPDPALHIQAPNDFPPPPPPVANPLQAQRMKKMLEERKNWSQMTPEQILRTTTTDELLPSPERDALGRNKNAAPLDRYLDRENQMHGSYTNMWQSDRNNSPWKSSRERDGQSGFDPGRDSMVDAAQRLNEYLNTRRIGGGLMNRNDRNSGWDSFNLPAPQKTDKPDVGQIAAMERFRQLLNPSPAPATEPSPDSKFFPIPKSIPMLDPYITQPEYVPNPAGSSFTPLTSGIGKPTGLTPLPGVVTTAIAPVTSPAWAPQPAPWLIQGPQPFVMPQRKF